MQLVLKQTNIPPKFTYNSIYQVIDMNVGEKGKEMKGH